MSLLEEEKRIVALVKNTGDYFHGNAGKDEGLRLFIVVRDFLIILDKVCKEVGEAQKRGYFQQLQSDAWEILVPVQMTRVNRKRLLISWVCLLVVSAFLRESWGSARKLPNCDHT
ncbi:FORMIN-LIKE PROTEIN [Salix koriyanagi]|uniref:FORMIN-LIKE PROTEIN n=1 Tax=Salix koriyanagi TaxID=2511006 RepID=A0A9Q0UDH1_9ROSI|nr:FORMIN-LIKE PROTEIN [Salix koriyanagi]